MSDPNHLPAAIPVTRMPPPGHYGVPGAPGVTALRHNLAGIATLAARRGAMPRLADAAHTSLGLALPAGPKAVATGAITVIGTAPGRWLVLSETNAELATTLRTALGPYAAVTDQTDALVTFDLSGPRVRDLLAKGIALDLDPAVFAPGDAATTVCALIGITLLRLDDAPGYRILVSRSYEAAFARFLVAGAAEYGLHLDARG